VAAVVIQRSAAAVLGLQEIKKHCRIDADLSDDGIAGGRQVDAITVQRAGQIVPVALSDFHVEQEGRLLCIKPRGSWPQCDAVPGAIRVDYQAGFGDGVDSLPADLRQWLRFRVATFYTYREQFADGSLKSLPDAIVDSLISHYKPDRVSL